MLSARVLGLKVARTSAGEEIVSCPFHDDSNPSSWWNPVKELFYCPVCQIGMNAKQLMNALGLECVLEGEEEREVPEYNLIAEKIILPSGLCMWNDYFEERAIAPAIVWEYGLEVKLDEPQGVILPITNWKGERVGVSIRFLKPKQAGTRYKFIGETRPLWPMHKLPKRSEGRLVITEGAWSAMRLTSFWGERGRMAFALMGAKANLAIDSLARPFHPVFLYDGDQAGVNACRKMRSFGNQHAYCLKTSPDDMTDEQLQELTERIERL